MRALIQYLHVHGSTPGPLFLLSDGTPLNRQRLTSFILVVNSSPPLLGSLVATLVIASALAQLFQQHLVAYQITSPTRLVNGSRYVIYTRTPITTIMGVAGQLTWQVLHVSSFLVVFVGCLRTLVVRGQDFPQLWAPLSLCKLAWVAPRVPSAWNGGS